MAIDYSQLSDEELAKIAGVTLPSKSPEPDYSKMSDEELAKIAGVTLEPKRSLIDKLGHNPVVDAINNLGYEAGELLATPFAALHNAVVPGVNKVLGTNLPKADANFSRFAPQPELAQLSGIPLSMMFMPSLGVSKVVGAIPSVTKNAGSLAKAIESMGRGGLAGAGEGAGWTGIFNLANQNNSNVTENMGFNSAVSGAIGAAPGSIGLADALARASINKFVKNIANKASPGGVLSPFEAYKAYQKAEPLMGDTKIDLGSLVNDKKLSRYYNEKLKNTLGAGSKIADNQEQLIASANQEANDIVKSLLGQHNQLSSADAIKDTLIKLKSKKEGEASEQFNSIFRDARARGVKFPGWNDAKRFAGEKLSEESNVVASGIGGELRKALTDVAKPEVQSAQASLQDMLLNPGAYTKNDLDKLKDVIIKNITEAKNNTDYSKAHFSHSNVGNLANELAAKSQIRGASVAHGLQEAMHNDIENALQNSGQTDLYKRWVKARADFKNQVSPLRDTSLNKIMNDEKDVNRIANELMADRNGKVLNQLGQKTKNLIVFEHLRSAMNEGRISPQRFLSEVNKLKNARKLDIADAQTLERMDSLGALNSMLPEAKIANNPPATGLRTKRDTEDLGKLALMLGSTALKPALGIGFVGGKYLLDNAKQRALTSDWLRNAYFKQAAKPFVNINQSKATDLTNALIRAYAQQKSGDKR